MGRNACDFLLNHRRLGSYLILPIIFWINLKSSNLCGTRETNQAFKYATNGLHPNKFSLLPFLWFWRQKATHSEIKKRVFYLMRQWLSEQWIASTRVCWVLSLRFSDVLYPGGKSSEWQSNECLHISFNRNNSYPLTTRVSYARWQTFNGRKENPTEA